MLTSTAYSGDEIIDRFFFDRFQDEIRERNLLRFSEMDDAEVKAEIADAFNKFILSLSGWKSFITLTFRDPVGVDVALAKLKSLIALLNRRAFGKSYTRVVGHSYFSYCVGVENQKRDVIHFHMLVDRPVDFDLIHNWWNGVAGFAYIEKIRDRMQVVSYVCKYVLKGGDVMIYKRSAKSYKFPHHRPIWFTS